MFEEFRQTVKEQRTKGQPKKKAKISQTIKVRGEDKDGKPTIFLQQHGTEMEGKAAPKYLRKGPLQNLSILPDEQTWDCLIKSVHHHFRQQYDWNFYGIDIIKTANFFVCLL